MGKIEINKFSKCKKQPLRKHEDICIFYKNQPAYTPQMSNGEPYDKGIRKSQLTGSYGDFNPVHVKSDGQRYPTDIIYFKTAESEGDVYHPTQKPFALLEYLIKTYTNEDDLVLDNCAGSGTTGIVANKLNRKYIGIEQEKEWFDIANERLTNFI